MRTYICADTHTQTDRFVKCKTNHITLWPYNGNDDDYNYDHDGAAAAKH